MKLQLHAQHHAQFHAQPPMPDLTELLQRASQGDSEARDALFATAYPELRRLAHARLQGGGRNTVLDTTALVHESYLRFLRAGQLRATEQRSFFAYAAQVMRSVIIDTVRERQAERRGGDLQRMTLDSAVADALPAGEDELLHVHEALHRRHAGRHRSHRAARLGQGAAAAVGAAGTLAKPQGARRCPVPEAQTWALMLGGLLAVGWFKRRTLAR
jgi:RNA polymerase sigma factor (TIGR02999 family)